MQAKGLVKFFGIALVLVCLYQLSFTFFAANVESKAEQYAEDKVANQTTLKDEEKRTALIQHRRQYLDSVSTQEVVPLLGYTYQEVKERQLNLGLDLQGGMSVVLQVSLTDLIKKMSNDNPDPTFSKALVKAKELQKDSETDFVTLFGQAFTALDPNARLAAIFSTPEYQEKINFQSTNEEVLAVIREEADGAVERTFEILRARIDKFGVTQPNINLLANTGRIVVELPGVDDPKRVRGLLQATAKLEFWETYVNSQEIGKMVADANNALKERLGIEEESGEADTKKEDAPSLSETENDTTKVAEDNNAAKTDTLAQANANSSTDNAGDDEESLVAKAEGDTAATEESDTSSLDRAAFEKENPFYAVFSQLPDAGSVVIAYVNGTDTAKFREYLDMPEVKAAFPENLKFLLDAKPREGNDGSNLFPVYAIKSRFSDFKPPLAGDVITDARQDTDANQQVVVSMSMNQEGAEKWRKLTAENLQKNIAIVLDERVYSAPTVQSEIGGGRSSITGNFTIAEASDLANILKAGKLPAKARIVEEAVVGPSLGQASIRAGLLSLVIGLVLVLVFMVVYYSTGGVVAIIALLANLFFVIGVLASLGATLTLPGMAGIVLTIGMAVDANVIIFERIREELARGSGVRKAIFDGYAKSYSAIIDANLTTLITAVILYYFGLGPVLGFATVLMIGIFSSLFTAILITRLIIDRYIANGKEVKYATKMSEGAFKNINFDFISKRKLYYVVAAVVIGIGLASFFTKGFELGVDFSGGRTYVVKFNESVTTSDIREDLTGVFEGAPLVRTYGSDDQVKITTSYLIDSDEAEADNIVDAKLYEGLQAKLGSTTKEEFLDKYVMSSQKVGPTIADDIKRGAFWATIFALMGIFAYILLRFRRWQFGLAAVLTICHDTLILLTIFSVFGGILPFSLEIDQTFIAALLTVIGYSINDTVVVFDRIREYLALNPKRDEKEVINDAINSTLSRTIITSLTTLLVVLILFLFGGDVIQGFSFALLIGIVVGTYSSIFIATPLVVDLSAQAAKRAKAQAAVTETATKKKKSKKKKKKTT